MPRKIKDVSVISMVALGGHLRLGFEHPAIAQVPRPASDQASSDCLTSSTAVPEA